MATPASLDVLGSAKYISLTTFRSDGTAVATPVWVVREADTLRVITDPMSGKAKRLRNNPDVLVSPCDMRGRVTPGAVSVTGKVAFQDADTTRATMATITKKYGLMGRVLTFMNTRRAKKASGGTPAHVGLTVTLDAAE